ncbi:MAG: copper chaperone PCu(A)C [Pseudonocardiales bacterium]|nr:copper chaperone PCu(A)C [Pseudonocardiales bacterium]MBV9032411.1 copper chaperone PCu(A)C [Pseudonocardiales bacterium]MBW0009748.1 copper chaperone PCu(A)C [Pseudonocardiales bacterium]
MRVPLIVAARIMACCAAALALVGCGAGQIAQTDSQVAAVDGAFGNVGSTIALRDVLIPYPHNQQGTYPAGSTVPVVLTIVNQADRADELIAVTSPAAGQALVLGTPRIPPGTTVTSTAGALPTTGEPTSPLVAGELRVVLTTNQPLHAGLNTPVTFQFRNAGKVTLPVPMAALPGSAGQAP